MKKVIRRPRIILYPYKMGSASVKLLQEELRKRGLKTMRVRKDGKYKPRVTDLIINWGCCAENNMWPAWERGGTVIGTGLNYCSAVAAARNKLATFSWFKDHYPEISIPEFTTNKEDLYKPEWIEKPTIARHSLTGQAGAGIEWVIWSTFANEDYVPDAPLYVKYIPKKAEYRVHVFGTGTEDTYSVIDVQQKKKKKDWTGERDTRIRNLANGYVFARENVVVPEDVLAQGKNAVMKLGLHFGAADVIWNEKKKRAYVLEVNTAPGLEGTTVIKYADAIEKEFKKRTGV